MPRSPLTVNTFQNPDGSPVANGYIRIRLSQIGSSNSQQIDIVFTKTLLNASGVIIGSPTFWPNSGILPAGTYYIIEVYNSSGQLIAGPNKVIV